MYSAGSVTLWRSLQAGAIADCSSAKSKFLRIRPRLSFIKPQDCAMQCYCYSTYTLALCGNVLAISHSASWPLGFKAGQQINLVMNQVNQLPALKQVYIALQYTTPGRGRIWRMTTSTQSWPHSDMWLIFQEKNGRDKRKICEAKPTRGTLVWAPCTFPLLTIWVEILVGSYVAYLAPVNYVSTTH